MDNFEEGMDAFINGEYDKAKKRFLAEIYDKDKEDSENRAMAAYFLGFIYEKEGLMQHSKTFLGKSGNLGNKDAQYKLGTLYQERGDYDFAMGWYVKANEAGHPSAEEKIKEIHKLRQDPNPYTACEGF